MVVCLSCGALPVVLVLVCAFSCNIEADALGRHDVVSSRGVVRAGGTVVHGCSFFCSALRVVFFVSLLLFLYRDRNMEGGQRGLRLASLTT